MVIGFFTRRAGLFSALATACLLPALALAADDQITQKSGAVITGKITGVSDGQVMVTSTTSNGGVARVPYRLSDIKSVIMTPPPEMAQVKDQPPATVVAALAPLVKAYAGLPADWVLDAMGQLADAYTDQGQTDQAAAVYAQINQLYPGSPYTNIATAGEANLLLKAGKADQALATLQPVITAADQTVSPGASDARAYAAAFLVYGQILEAQKKFPEALEAFLTVKTVFYQNQALVDQSDELVKKLRVTDPGVSVN
jgi:tetratricopeptide (TPR) repeat protein